MQWFSQNLQRIHAAVLTDGARAAVEYADGLLRAAEHEAGSLALDLIKESRQWVAQAYAIDKAAADGEIAKIAAKIEAKMNRGAAGGRIAARRAAMRVVPGGT